MPRLTLEQEHARDVRDRTALQMRDAGHTQAEIADCLKITRGPLVKLFKEVDADRAAAVRDGYEVADG